MIQYTFHSIRHNILVLYVCCTSFHSVWHYILVLYVCCTSFHSVQHYILVLYVCCTSFRIIQHYILVLYVHCTSFCSVQHYILQSISYSYHLFKLFNNSRVIQMQIQNTASVAIYITKQHKTKLFYFSQQVPSCIPATVLNVLTPNISEQLNIRWCVRSNCSVRISLWTVRVLRSINFWQQTVCGHTLISLPLLLEKLTLPQLVNKLSSFYGIQRFMTFFTTVPVLSHVTSVCIPF